MVRRPELTDAEWALIAPLLPSQQTKGTYYKDQRLIPGAQQVENAFVESLNGRFRDECLNGQWFISLGDARELIEHRRQACNHAQPQSDLACRPRRRRRADAHTIRQGHHVAHQRCP